MPLLYYKQASQREARPAPFLCTVLISLLQTIAEWGLQYKHFGTYRRKAA